jgi:hypothetical protein
MIVELQSPKRYYQVERGVYSYKTIIMQYQFKIMRICQFIFFQLIPVLLYLQIRLLDVRGRLYELLTHCIPADVIMKVRKMQA